MSKMSQLHSQMSDSYSMGVENERERVLNIISIGLQVADVIGAIDVLQMMKRMVSEGVEISAPKTIAKVDDPFNATFEIRPGLDENNVK